MPSRLRSRVWSVMLLAFVLLVAATTRSAIAQDDATPENEEAKPKGMSMGQAMAQEMEMENEAEKKTGEGAPEEDEVEVFASGFAVYQDGAANNTLYIRGNGFTEDLTFEFEPPIAIGKRVTMFMVSEGEAGTSMFGLRLMKGKTWLKTTPTLPFETLYVTKATRAGKVVFEPKENVPVARVFPRPEISADYEPEEIKDDQIEFVIKGTNLSPKETKFAFDPPLEARKDYDYVIDETGSKMTLTLRRKAVWRETSGPLNVVAVLGGAGRISLPKPVTVATVTAAVKADGKTGTDFEQLSHEGNIPTIYRTYRGTTQFSIKGSGFRAERPPVLKFQGKAAIQDVDFELTVVSKTELVLRLKKTSNGWLDKPGILSCVEMNGEALPYSIDVAEVVETPEVEKDRKQLAYESQTLTIVVTGKGFVDGQTKLNLLPNLVEGVDYNIHVRDSKWLELELVEDKKWPRGSLNIVWVQIGDARKIYQNKDQMDKGIRIALIEPDFEGVVQIKASSQRIYQSETNTIKVDVIVLPPKFELKDGEDVPVGVELASADAAVKAASADRVTAYLQVSETSAATLVMMLVDPSKDKWLEDADRLLLSAILLPTGTEHKPLSYPLGNVKASDETKRGVQIARVLPDIRVQYLNPPPIVFTSHTTAIKVRGSGFTFLMSTGHEVDFEDGDGEGENGEGTAEESTPRKPQPVVFDPPLVQDEDFMVIFDSDKELSVELLGEGKKWRATPGPLKLVSLDSGGGPVKIDAVIARVADDDPNMLCDDDCPYLIPFDGDCGDYRPNPETGALDCFGRDCADCGPRKKEDKPAAEAQLAQDSLCSDSCGGTFIKDGTCEDGRPGAWGAQCPLCSDCSDCGECRENKYANMPLCTNGIEGSEGELVPGIPCVFPFTYKGEFYDGSTGCVKDGRVSGGWGWCPTTENYEQDGKWGSCQYCVDVLSDPSLLEENMDYYDDREHDGVMKKSSSAFHRAEKGFDFLRWIVNTLFFLVVFAAIGSLFLVVYRRRAVHRYQLVDSKAN